MHSASMGKINTDSMDFDTRKLSILYSPHHHLHAPKVEFMNGRLLAYPEVPERVDSMRDYLVRTSIPLILTEPEIAISKDEIKKTHCAGMVDYLEQMSGEVNNFLANDDNFLRLESVAPDTEYFYAFVFPSRPFMARMASSTLGHHGYYCFDTEGPIGFGTWPAILYSATLAAEGANCLLCGQFSSAYALCRPPGHHAGPDFFGGYCYFNNAAIAVKRLTDAGKVAVIDIDYHHGNGTQATFWEDPSVFYASLHADPDFEYPYFSGHSDEIGEGKGKGTNFNIPLPRGTRGTEYLAALERIIQRVYKFSPSSLVVSVGFDTYSNDPLGFFDLVDNDYKDIGAMLAQLNMPTLFVQEGGYSLESQGNLAEQLIRGFHSM